MRQVTGVSMMRWRGALPLVLCALAMGIIPQSGRSPLVTGALRPALGSGPAAPDAVLAAAAGPVSAAAVRCSVPAGVHAEQVIMVVARGTTARVAGCTRQDGGGYVRTLAPMAARVGYNGVAPAGRKREGDGRTPSGAFRLGGGFGSGDNPGLGLGWYRTDRRDVWVDDPRSELYNTHQRTPVRGRWRSAEKMRVPAYRYAQVVKYNPKRVAGRGSAIFLHVGSTATAGCVALAAPDLIRLMRWEQDDDIALVIR